METAAWHLWVETPGFSPGLEWQFLWMAFRPHHLLYVHRDGVDELVRMERMSTDCCELRWTVQTTEIVYDGSSFGRRTGRYTIERYDFYKPFDELPLYPLEYHPEKERVLSEAISRGHRIVTFNNIHYCHYSGNAELMSPFRDQTFHGEIDYHPLRTALVSWGKDHCLLVIDIGRLQLALLWTTKRSPMSDPIRATTSLPYIRNRRLSKMYGRTSRTTIMLCAIMKCQDSLSKTNVGVSSTSKQYRRSSSHKTLLRSSFCPTDRRK